MIRRSMRFLCLILLFVLLLLVLGSAPLQAPPIRLQGGAGGVSQGVLRPPTPSPSPTPAPSSQGTIYGGRGPGGSCFNPVGGGAFATILQQDFHWGTDHLSARYRQDTVDRLCNDYWAWFDPNGQDVPARQVLSTLHWPPDLFAQPWLDGFVHVSWIAISFPTTPTPVCPGNGNCGEPSNPACFVSLLFGQTWNICDPIRAIINAVANAISQGYQQSAAQVTFLWQTPLAPFQEDNAHLLNFWNSSWAIVLLCVTAVVAWGALRSMVGAVVSWLSYAQVIELLPRLVFALLAALLSRQFFVLLIQANNALSSHFAPTLLETIVGHPNPGIKLGLVQILFGALGFALIVEEAARLALLYVLFAASPLLFFLAALPETQHWALGAARAAIMLAFLQAIQAFILDVGNRLFDSVLAGQNDLTVLHLLVALALLYLALVVFFALMRLAFGTSGYWVAGFPLLALVALRSGTRGAGRNLSRAFSVRSNTLAMPGGGGTPVQTSPRVGQRQAGGRQRSARPGGGGPAPRGGTRGGGGGNRGGGGAGNPRPGVAPRGNPGPGPAGPLTPQANPRPARPGGGVGRNPTVPLAPPSSPRVQSTAPPPAPGAAGSATPRRPPVVAPGGPAPQPRSSPRRKTP